MGAESIHRNRIKVSDRAAPTSQPAQASATAAANDSALNFLAARHAAESLLASQGMAQQFQALKDALSRPVEPDRRRYGRIPLPMLLQVTPLDSNGQPQEELTTTVVGKDISPRGVSFFHQQPLPYRRAVVTFEHPEVGEFTMEVDIGWCQFTEHGWYVSGARQMRAGGQRAVREATPETDADGDAD
jgi:hypothetical protein